MTTHKTQETQENASKPLLKTLLASAALWAVSGAAMADITIGVSLPLTGPASGLGIPMGNAIKLWPTSIAGEKLNVIVLDDATDPTKGVQNAQRFVTQDKADIVMGSAATPVAIAMSDTVAAASTPHFMFSPAVLQAGKDAWAFRLPQSNAVMSHALLGHMKKLGVKSVGFLGYTDAYGESWLKDFQAEAAKIAPEIKVVATERFARSDTSVTAQALKLVVGFAAETNNVAEYARKKLEAKRLDMIVANDVSRSDIGFNSSENEVLLVYPDRTELLEKAPKTQIAFQIIERACRLAQGKAPSWRTADPFHA